MKRFTSAVPILLLGMMAALPAEAQEVQVFLDAEGRIDRIDAALARELGLFVDRFPDLREVRLFLQVADSTFVLEVTRTEAGTVYRERQPLTAEDVEALRRQVSDRLAARTPVRVLDREGRVELVAGSALLGLAFYGWAIPESLDLDGRAWAGTYMLTAAGSIVAPWLATRHAPIGDAMADLALHGGTRGILRGMLLHHLVTGGDDGESDRYRSRLISGVAGSVAEGLGAYWWARRAGMHRGHTYSIANGSDFGMLAGLGVAGLIDPDETGDGRLYSGLTLAGAGVGIPAAWHLARRRDYTHGDAHLMGTAGYLGIAAGLTMIDWTGTDAARPFIAGAMAGGLGGLAVADRLVRHTDLSLGQARLIRFGTLAGGALGAGTGYLIGPDDLDDPTLFLTLGTLGATAGFALAYRAIAPEAATSRDRDASNLRFEIVPRLAGVPAGNRPGGRVAPSAALRLEYRLP